MYNWPIKIRNIRLLSYSAAITFKKKEIFDPNKFLFDFHPARWPATYPLKKCVYAKKNVQTNFHVKHN